MNSFSKNKEIVSVCKNYYNIVNSDVYESDKFTHNMIRLYKDFIFGMDIVTQREKEKMVCVDNIMYKFVTDKEFRKDVVSRLSNLTVSRNVVDVVGYVMNKMIEFFEDYKDTYTRNIYIPRWI